MPLVCKAAQRRLPRRLSVESLRSALPDLELQRAVKLLFNRETVHAHPLKQLLVLSLRVSLESQNLRFVLLSRSLNLFLCRLALNDCELCDAILCLNTHRRLRNSEQEKFALLVQYFNLYF